MQQNEGYIDFKGYKTWYATYGDLSKGATPLVGLHGGPGWPHYSLLPLSGLADQGIPVILYDQLGCGKSQRITDTNLMTVESYVEELDTLKHSLGLTTMNLLGHSWGGTLALEYTLAHPESVHKLILSSPLLDTALWVEEAIRLRDSLPPETASAMRRHEADGTTNDPEYTAAYRVFEQNFVCRVVPEPEDLSQANAEAGRNVYLSMWGPSESFATGTLKSYSVIDRLKNVQSSTLLLSGAYDEATPKQIEIAKQNIPGCEWLLLKNSSHSALFEEPERYLEAVASFVGPKKHHWFSRA